VDGLKTPIKRFRRVKIPLISWYLVKKRKKAFGSLWDLRDLGSQFLVDEVDRRQFSTQERQDFTNRCQIDTWAQIVERLFQMEQETSRGELLMTGTEFSSRWLFDRRPEARVDHTMWHAVAADVKLGLDISIEIHRKLRAREV
jgi:hypothetical protein